MCIVFYTVHLPGYPLVLASNRDEYLDRPAVPAAWHAFEPLVDSYPTAAASSSSAAPVCASDSSSTSTHTHTSADAKQTQTRGHVLSGRDAGKAVGGTWLGMTRDLRVGVVTNIRHPYPSKSPTSLPSRGDLLKQFLAPPPQARKGEARSTVQEYLQSYLAQAEEYDGFNLLLFKITLPDKSGNSAYQSGSSQDEQEGGILKWKTEIGYLSNRPTPTIRDLSPPGPTATTAPIPAAQIHTQGLSNSPYDQPWHKVTAGRERMAYELNEWEQARFADRHEAGGHDGAGTDSHEDKEKDLVERMMRVLSQTQPLTSLADTTRTTLLTPLLVGTGKGAETPLEQKPGTEGESASGVKGRWYGTRVSTVILIREDGRVVFVERDMAGLDESGQVRVGGGERWFEFVAEDGKC